MGKIDCSITKNYFAEKARIIQKCIKCKTINCDKCELSKHSFNYDLGHIEINKTEKAIEIVQEWSDKNPIKTYKDHLKEILPNSNIEYLTKENCPSLFFNCEQDTGTFDSCGGNPDNCWDRPYTEQTETNK